MNDDEQLQGQAVLDAVDHLAVTCRQAGGRLLRVVLDDNAINHALDRCRVAHGGRLPWKGVGLIREGLPGDPANDPSWVRLQTIDEQLRAALKRPGASGPEELVTIAIERLQLAEGPRVEDQSKAPDLREVSDS